MPYGTIMLACFKTKYQQIMNRSYGGSFSEFSAPSTGTHASSSTNSSPSVRHGFIGAFAPSSHVPPTADGVYNGDKRGSLMGSSRSRGSGDGQWSDISSPWSLDTARERSGGNGDGSAGGSSNIPPLAPQSSARHTDDDSAASSPQPHGEEGAAVDKKPKKRMRKSESVSEAAAGPSRSVDNDVPRASIDGAADPNKRCSSCKSARRCGASMK